MPCIECIGGVGIFLVDGANDKQKKEFDSKAQWKTASGVQYIALSGRSACIVPIPTIEEVFQRVAVDTGAVEEELEYRQAIFNYFLAKQHNSCALTHMYTMFVNPGDRRGIADDLKM